MNDSYIYAYYERGAYLPFYIGKGRKKRAYAHIKQCVRENDPAFRTRFYTKLRKMLREDNSPIVLKLYEGLSESDAFNKEKLLIGLYGRLDTATGCLCNHTDGGEGQSGRVYSEASLKKMSESHKGKRPTAEHNANMIAAVIRAKAKPVECVNSVTGNVIRRYVSIREAARQMKVHNSLIAWYIKHEKYDEVGLGWRYAEKVE